MLSWQLTSCQTCISKRHPGIVHTQSTHMLVNTKMNHWIFGAMTDQYLHNLLPPSKVGLMWSPSPLIPEKTSSHKKTRTCLNLTCSDLFYRKLCFFFSGIRSRQHPLLRTGPLRNSQNKQTHLKVLFNFLVAGKIACNIPIPKKDDLKILIAADVHKPHGCCRSLHSSVTTADCLVRCGQRRDCRKSYDP